MTRFSLLSVAPLLGMTEALTIESLRLAGTIVAALASVYGAYRAHQSGRDARETKRELRRLRGRRRRGDRRKAEL